MNVEGEIIFFGKDKSESDYEGKIVITKDLNPEYIIIKLRHSKAIIAERGGITSHGAILAMEMNIPCVILSDAMRKLKERTVVKMDENGQIISDEVYSVPSKTEKQVRRFTETENGWVMQVYKYSKLRQSLGFSKGIEMTNNVLFGKNRKVLTRIEGDNIYFKWMIKPEKLVEKIFKNPVWYRKKIQERRIFYKGLKKKIRHLIKIIENGELKPIDSLKELKSCRRFIEMMQSYIPLTQYPIDIIDKEFYDLANKHVPREMLYKLFKLVAKSKYQEYLLEKGIDPPVREKRIVFPPNKITFIDLEPSYDNSVKIPDEYGSVLKKCPERIRNKIIKYIETLPKMIELADETANTARLMMTCISNLAYIIAKYLVEKEKIKMEDDILDFSIDEVENMMGVTI